MKTKYEIWYEKLCLRGQTRITDEYTEYHHIIPESFFINRKRKGLPGWLPGDSDAPENLTRLTDREHELAHYLLVKIYQNDKRAYYKVLKAYEMRSLVNQNQFSKRYFSSRRLAGIRAERARLQSEKHKGEGNPFYGFQHTDKAKKLIGEKNSGDNNGAKQEEARQKIANSKLGKKRAPFSEEWLANMSKSKQGKNNPRYGVEVSESTRQKQREKATGRKQSPETIQKKADAIRGRTKPKILCPHCQQMIAVNTYPRWHGANCKSLNNPPQGHQQ